MKKIASAMLYCVPVIWRSFSKPSILALPVLVSLSGNSTDGLSHTNVGSIYERDQVQDEQHRHQSPVDLAQDSFSLLIGESC
jgi:hypothetical protein